MEGQAPVVLTDVLCSAIQSAETLLIDYRFEGGNAARLVMHRSGDGSEKLRESSVVIWGDGSHAGVPAVAVFGEEAAINFKSLVRVVHKSRFRKLVKISMVPIGVGTTIKVPRYGLQVVVNNGDGNVEFLLFSLPTDEESRFVSLKGERVFRAII